MSKMLKIVCVIFLCIYVLPFAVADEAIWFSPNADVNAIKKLLTETGGANIDVRNSLGQTGLMYAVNMGSFGDFGRFIGGTDTGSGLVEELIKYGADVNAKSDRSPREEDHSFANTPLHYAAIIVNPRNSVALIDYLIRAGADVNAQNNLKETPLMWSSQASLAENLQAIFKEMITNLADVNMQNNVGNTYLHLLIRNKDSLGMQYMMEHFGSMFDLNLKSREGMSAGDLKNNPGWTPLEYAKNTLQPESVRAIQSFRPLGTGDNIRIRDELGRTPLMLAVLRNDLPFAERQIDVLHANVEDTDTTKYRNAPLHFAVIRQYNVMPFIVLLLNSKADPNIKNAFGDTPLHYLVKYNIKSPERDAVAKLLIEKGANPNIPNKKGETALDLARRVNTAFAGKLTSLFQAQSTIKKSGDSVAGGNLSSKKKTEEIASPVEPGKKAILPVNEGAPVLKKVDESSDVRPLVAA